MPVVSVKVSDKTKKQMEELKDKVEWPSEIRGFIESRLEQVRRDEALERAEKALGKHHVDRGTASKLVREARDRRH